MPSTRKKTTNTSHPSLLCTHTHPRPPWGHVPAWRTSLSPAGQVDQVDLGVALAGQPLDQRRLREADGEDGVAARAGVVHAGAGRGAVGVAPLDQLLGNAGWCCHW